VRAKKKRGEKKEVRLRKSEKKKESGMVERKLTRSKNHAGRDEGSIGKQKKPRRRRKEKERGKPSGKENSVKSESVRDMQAWIGHLPNFRLQG